MVQTIFLVRALTRHPSIQGLINVHNTELHLAFTASPNLMNLLISEENETFPNFFT